MNRSRPDRGAVSVWVAILMVPLLVVAALAIDVGAAHADRQRLQTGADAAALAIAQQCAEGGECSRSAAAALAQELASLNDPLGGAATVTEVELDEAGGWVEVQTASGADHWFAPVIGVDRSALAARGAASWEASFGGILPLAVPHCFIDQMPIFGDEDAALATTFYNKFHKAIPPEAVGCQNTDGWSVAPGNFGWLKPDPACLEGIRFDSQGAVADPGNNATCDLVPVVGQRVLVPVHSGSNGGTGSNLRLTIIGYLDFTLEGVKLSGGGGTGDTGCSGSERCFTGTVHGWLDSLEGGRPPAVAGTAQLRLPGSERP